MKTTVEKLNGDKFTFEDGEPVEIDEILPDTCDLPQYDCRSCGNREALADDLEARRGIECYRGKRHG